METNKFIPVELSDQENTDLTIFLRSFKINVAALKKSHFVRRIKTRMTRTGTNTVHEYIAYVRKNIKEQEQLKQAFSINVTHFFRNPDTWEAIEKQVFFILRRNNARIKIWSAGCADGAEPYTLAMIANKLGLPAGQVKIVASDYNKDSLEIAKKGVYPKDYDKELPEDYKNKYFTKIDSGYQIDTKTLLPYIDFKFHNLIEDNILKIGKNYFNMVLCRNVMIYFTKEHQDILYDKFYDALRIDGFFIVGRSEIILGDFKSRFSLFNANHRISRKV